MSTVEGTVVPAATLAPLETEPALASDPGLGRRGRRAANLLITGGWALPLLDFVALAAGFACAVVLTNAGDDRLVMGIFPFLGVLVLAARGAYGLRLRLIVLDSVGLAAGSISVAAMGTLAFGLLLRSSHPGAALLFPAWLLGIGFVGIVRTLFTLWQRRRRVAGITARRTVVIGAGEVGARIGRRLEQSPGYGLLPIGYIDDFPPEADDVGGRPAPVLGPLSELVELVDAHQVEHVILAFSSAPDGEVLPQLRRCAAQGVGVSLVPRLFDLVDSRLAYEPVGALPVATLHKPTRSDRRSRSRMPSIVSRRWR